MSASIKLLIINLNYLLESNNFSNPFILNQIESLNKNIEIIKKYDSDSESDDEFQNKINIPKQDKHQYKEIKVDPFKEMAKKNKIYNDYFDDPFARIEKQNYKLEELDNKNNYKVEQNNEDFRIYKHPIDWLVLKTKNLEKYNGYIIEVVNSPNECVNGFYKVVGGNPLKLDQYGKTKNQRKKHKNKNNIKTPD